MIHNEKEKRRKGRRGWSAPASHSLLLNNIRLTFFTFSFQSQTQSSELESKAWGNESNVRENVSLKAAQVFFHSAN